MSHEPASSPHFYVTHAAEPSKKVIAGFSQFGLAGLTAVDYLVEQLELEEAGYIRADIPSITPFADGRPRHATRLLSREDVDLTILLNEQFIPVWASTVFSEAVLGWMESSGVEETTILSGVPYPHGPEDHDTFYIATDDYVDTRLAGKDVRPMGSGFLDGVNASIVERGMSSDLRVGVLITPVHEQIPDAEAALRLLETTNDLYGLDVDLGPLEEFAGRVEQYYSELSERLNASAEEERPEDRMFG